MKERNKKRGVIVLMLLLILIWSFDYVVAKHALETFDPLSLLHLKYTVGLVLMVIIKRFADPGLKLQRRDLGTLIACSIMGEIVYFYCEYSALDYLPVSLITILLAFVPAVSILIEIIVYRVIPSRKLVIGILFSAVGVMLIIGVDLRALMEGRLIGYLFVFGAILAWNAYNFITARLHANYSSISLTVMQLACTVLLLSPYAYANFPGVQVFTPDIIGGIIYLGIFGAGIGFFIQVKALHILGPTTTALFSNFMPVVATIMGWILLNETISLLQGAGGVLVIAAGYFVIKEKGKAEESLK
jgi:drug/metabolite transporter (DMT)-like permease